MCKLIIGVSAWNSWLCVFLLIQIRISPVDVITFTFAFSARVIKCRTIAMSLRYLDTYRNVLLSIWLFEYEEGSLNSSFYFKWQRVHCHSEEQPITDNAITIIQWEAIVCCSWFDQLFYLKLIVFQLYQYHRILS